MRPYCILIAGLIVLGADHSLTQVITVPGSYNFGTRRVGSSNLWILAIQNQGSQPLNVDSITFTTEDFAIDSVPLPLTVPPASSRNVRVWFFPRAPIAFSDTMKLHSNATNLPVAPVGLSGQGDSTPIPLGTPLWMHNVPLHPISNTFRRVKAVRAIGDISGDGKPDVIVCTENYWTMALDGNASVSTDSLWAFNTYISSYSAGSIGTTGDYSYQKALAIASDLNGDGYNDVVIGTGGGNEHVYAISGRSGQMLWTFGTDHPDSFSLGDITGVDASTDFTNDGIPDVVAAAAATQSGGVGGRRSAYLFNGTNGALLWQASLPGFTHAVTAIPDINGDGIADVIGTVGESAYRASAFSGANGATLWNFPVASATGGAKELLVLPIPGQPPDIILGAFWGPIYRLNGATGTMIWERSTNGRDPTRMVRLRDLNNDGIDEIAVSLLVGDALCLDGATGNILWSYPANSGMDITTIPDLNRDGFDEVAVASQNNDVLILRGQNGQLLHQFSFPGGSEQARSVAAIADVDSNGSFELIAGSDLSNVVMLSGGLDAGPVGVGGSVEIPSEFSVSQNYPNPFNPTTTIEIRLPTQTDLKIQIFDILGREIRSFEYIRVPPGVHTIIWDGTNARGVPVASGVYFYRVRTNEQSAIRRMLVMK